MNKKNNQIKLYLKFILTPLFFIVIFTLESFAQDIDNINNQSLIVSANIDPDQMSISYNGDENTNIKMKALKLRSHLIGTDINAVYNYEKNEFELGLSNAVINGYLGKGMKLELQTNTDTGSGSIMFRKLF